MGGQRRLTVFGSIQGICIDILSIHLGIICLDTPFDNHFSPAGGLFLVQAMLGLNRRSRRQAVNRIIMKSIQKNQTGFTLIEIMAVLVIISVLAGVGVKKFDLISEAASREALVSALSELNSRELLTWALIKFSDEGWITDDGLFSTLDKNLGQGYSWYAGPTPAGGTLHMTSAEMTLTRTPSTVSSAGKWAAY
jgi:prepilin-type N-terminal cleavage/methylation domain-containing protein